MRATLKQVAEKYGADLLIEEHFLDGSAHIVIRWTHKDGTVLDAMLLKNGMNWYYGDDQCGSFSNAVMFAITTRNTIHNTLEGYNADLS